MSPIRLVSALAPAAFCLLPINGALAHLGGQTSSIAGDRGRMSARLNSVAMGHYTRHELTRPNGGTVHEFTNAEGVVFAVTWSGPGKPDLSVVLGPYFAAFQADSVATARRMHALRQPVRTNETDLQIQSGGHMGWFHGVAYVRSLAPADFSPEDLAEKP